jgi:acyl-CoA synthetase (AMP-forming)/AMP-acid ligase II
VVSVNPPARPKAGTIGKPLVGVELCIRDLESGQIVESGQMGMLYVAGKTVFPGYIGHDGPSPFKEFDGKRWYESGDLAALDEEGYVLFHGRLKRFIKAGGEMISLPALEEPFTRKYPPTENGPRVAIEGIELEHGRKIVLFTTEKIELKEANAILTEDGFRGIMRLDEVRQVTSIPVLGTGKTDYKVLRKLLEA